ncbi:MAG TPA: metal ABC transporter substrate-binding protein [Verrucomicrobiae bacterium]|nr:metal ABC transporter substrate-binding protein [Verrucomicrobiae bacterium]
MKNRMFRFLFLIAIGVVMFAATAAHAAGKVRVVTTLTDLADLTRNIGGEHVDVFSLATGVEDTHGVPMKPSFVPRLNQADLLVLVGFGCEHAFLPALLEASKNPRIQYGKTGYVDCSKGVVPLEVPKSTDHSEGDVHPYGNPHYMLDPVLAKTAVQNIYDGLVAIAPQYRDDFTRNRDAYLAKLDAKIAEWEEAMKPLKGIKFVSYHEHWPYFASRFGLVYFGTIELKPGVDPTPRHITELVSSMKAEHVTIVVREPQFPEKVPSLIAQQTGATLIKLPIMPGGVANTSTYIEMMDYIIHSFVTAAGTK